MPASGVYFEAMSLLVARLGDQPEAALELACAACPGWSVRDVVAHVAHVLDELAAGTLPLSMLVAAVRDADEAVRLEAGADRDRFTQAGVVARRGLSWSALVAEWADAFERAGDRSALLAGDLVVHVLDIEEALPAGDELPPSILRAGLSAYSAAQQGHLRARGLVPVAWQVTDLDERFAADVSEGIVAGPGVSLLRAALGRCSRAEANRDLTWQDVPPSVGDVFPVYGGWRASQP